MWTTELHRRRRRARAFKPPSVWLALACRPSCHCRRVSALPKNRCFKPNGVPLHDLEEIVLSLDGLEALRLADVEDMNMDVAAAQMGVSRHTFGRLLRRARHCVAQALVRGMPADRLRYAWRT